MQSSTMVSKGQVSGGSELKSLPQDVITFTSFRTTPSPSSHPHHHPRTIFYVPVLVVLIGVATVACLVALVVNRTHEAPNNTTTSTSTRLAQTFHLASYYGDHMVLQRGPRGAFVWGFGKAGAEVVVRLYNRSRDLLQEHRSNVSAESRTWSVTLDPMDAGGPFSLNATQWSPVESGPGGGVAWAEVVISDVWFGEVWLCGGQSNMQMTVKQVVNASWELNQAANFSLVRLFAVSLKTSLQPLDDFASVALPWSLPTADRLGMGDYTVFSAVCWFFGRNLHRTLGVPVGLVQSCWGGTPIESWSSPRALARCGLNSQPQSSGQQEPTVLWNAMIHPLLNMTLKGVIWYQGERNTGYNTDLYNCSFPAMINDWRREFYTATNGNTDPLLPFGFAQISTSDPNDNTDSYPRIRWHQSADYGFSPNSRMPKTFMAVTIDLCDRTSSYGWIHPRYKQEVATRLLLGAMAVAYNDSSSIFQGPFPELAIVNLTTQMLVIKYGQELIHHNGGRGDFQICCSQVRGQCLNNDWHPAPILSVQAQSVFLNISTCISTSRAVTSVRYAWSNWPCELHACALYGEGPTALPAPPFIKDVPLEVVYNGSVGGVPNGSVGGVYNGHVGWFIMVMLVGFTMTVSKLLSHEVAWHAGNMSQPMQPWLPEIIDDGDCVQ
ncbi:sialate O-acetylesterase-like [Lampetra fluviatilis]